MECVLLDGGSEADHGMIFELQANIRLFEDHGDPIPDQIVGGANSRQEEKLGGINGPSTKNDFLRSVACTIKSLRRFQVVIRKGFTHGILPP